MAAAGRLLSRGLLQQSLRGSWRGEGDDEGWWIKLLFNVTEELSGVSGRGQDCILIRAHPVPPPPATQVPRGEATVMLPPEATS